MGKKKIGIIGATGYTGSELVRILTNHPDVEITMITSESRAGELFSDVHPFLQGIADQKLVSINQMSPMILRVYHQRWQKLKISSPMLFL